MKGILCSDCYFRKSCVEVCDAETKLQKKKFEIPRKIQQIQNPKNVFDLINYVKKPKTFPEVARKIIRTNIELSESKKIELNRLRKDNQRRLYELKHKNGLSQSEIAIYLGISKQAVSKKFKRINEIAENEVYPELNRKQKIMALCFWERWSQKDVATELGITQQAVSKTVIKLRKKYNR